MQKEIDDLKQQLEELKSDQARGTIKRDETGTSIDKAKQRKMLSEVFRLVPNYSGSREDPPFSEWVRNFNEAMNIAEMDEETAARVIPMFLEGNAKFMWRRLDDSTKQNWREMLRRLKVSFAPRDSQTEGQTKLAIRRQKPGESVVKLADAIQSLVDEAYPSPDFTDANRTSIAISSFLSKLRPALAGPIQRRDRPKTMEEAIRIAVQEEKLQEDLIIAELQQGKEERAVRIVQDLERVQTRISAVEARQFRGFGRGRFQGNGLRRGFASGFRGGFQQGRGNFGRPRSRGRGRGRGRGTYRINNVKIGEEGEEEDPIAPTTSSRSTSLPFGLFVAICLVALVTTINAQQSTMTTKITMTTPRTTNTQASTTVGTTKTTTSESTTTGVSTEKPVETVNAWSFTKTIEWARERLGAMLEWVKAEPTPEQDEVTDTTQQETSVLGKLEEIKKWFRTAGRNVRNWSSEVGEQIGNKFTIVWKWLTDYFLAVVLLMVTIFSIGAVIYVVYLTLPVAQRIRMLCTKRRRRRRRATEKEEERQVNLIRLDQPRVKPYLTFIPILIAVVTAEGTKFPYIPLHINNCRTMGLFDSGAQITYCQKSLVDKLNSGYLEARLPPAKAANGTEIKFLGRFPATILIGEVVVNQELHFTADRDCPASVVIGCDVMRSLNQKGQDISINLLKEEIRVGRKSIPFVKRQKMVDTAAVYTLTIDETITVAPMTDNVIWAKIQGFLPTNWTMLTGPDRRWNGSPENFLEIGHTVAHPLGGSYLPMRIRNSSRATYQLFKNQKIGQAEAINGGMGARIGHVAIPSGSDPFYVSPEVDWEKEMPKFADPKQKPVEDRANLSSPLLQGGWREKLRAVLRKCKAAFVGLDGYIGHYRGPIVHRIELEEDAVPQRQPAYRVPLHLRKEVERQLQDMLRQGIIQESSSPWAAPIVLVLKADKTSYRFAVDYRRLNSVTKKQAYHLPQIQDILDLTVGKRIYSKFDLQAGYHQVSLLPAHAERSAFITHCGLFQFTRLPFGISSAPTTFQRVMDHTLRHCKAAVFVYLDDVIVGSSTMMNHLRDIEEVLQRFIVSGLKLRVDKCEFCVAEIKYLGFLISEQGMRPDPKNLEAIRKFPTPTTSSQVRSFLGAVGYFRRFILNFAKIAEPLARLTRSEVKFEWKEEHEESFRLLIQRLSSAPILAPPRLDRPFEIWTDASGIAISGILLQADDDGFLHPIVFASRMLSKHERNYKFAIEWEALAIVFAVKQFRPYIEGLHTIVVTDHKPLQALMKRRDLEGRLARYQLVLAPYDLTIIYREGALNYLADILSRSIPEEGIRNNTIAAVTRSTMKEAKILGLSVTREEIIQELAKESFWQKVHDFLSTEQYPEGSEASKIVDAAKSMTSIGPMLYKKTRVDNNRTTGPLLFIPYTLRKRIIEEVHGNPIEGAHLGINKLTAKMMQRYWWPSMREDIRQVVTECNACQRRKTPATLVSKEPMYFPEAPSRCFERMHSDILGPLKQTERGNRVVLVNICAFSKFAITSALPDQRSETVANAFVKDVFSIHGAVETLVTDQGRNYMSQVLKDLAQIIGYKQLRVTAYHARGNGQVERLNRTLGDMIATCVAEHPLDWDQVLSLVTFAYNTSVQESIGDMPYFIVFGRNPRLMSDVALQLPIRTYNDVQEYKQVIGRQLRDAWSLVRQRIEQQQQKQKQHYDEQPNIKEHEFKEGDLILIKFPKAATENTKFDDPWKGGPYRVEKVRHPDVTAVHLENGTRLTVHADRAKLFRESKTLALRRNDQVQTTSEDRREDFVVEDV